MELFLVIKRAREDPEKGMYAQYTRLFADPLAGATEEDRWKAEPGHPTDIRNATQGELTWEKFVKQTGVTASMIEQVNKSLDAAKMYFAKSVNKSGKQNPIRQAASRPGVLKGWPEPDFHPDHVGR